MQDAGAVYVVCYFFSFYTVSVFMLTNIFVAVVLENFEVLPPPCISYFDFV